MSEAENMGLIYLSAVLNNMLRRDAESTYLNIDQ